MRTMLERVENIVQKIKLWIVHQRITQNCRYKGGEMVKRKQFDDFYFIKDGKIHTLDEVQEQYEKTMEIYLIFKDV